MQTGLEGVAAKAREDTKLVFTSLSHHITRELIKDSLKHTPTSSAAGIDGIDVRTAKDTFDIWIEEMETSIHRKSYKAPAVRRVWIPKSGKDEKRPIGVPCIADRALQRSVSTVLNAIYEEDFLNYSFGGRPGRGAHNALTTMNELITYHGKKDKPNSERTLQLRRYCLLHYLRIKEVVSYHECVGDGTGINCSR